MATFDLVLLVIAAAMCGLVALAALVVVMWGDRRGEPHGAGGDSAEHRSE